MKPQISITTDGREGKKLMDATFPQILCYSFHFDLIYVYIFFCRVITAYDKDKLIVIGLMRLRSGNNVVPSKCVNLTVRVLPYACVSTEMKITLWTVFVFRQDSGSYSGFRFPSIHNLYHLSVNGCRGAGAYLS